MEVLDILLGSGVFIGLYIVLYGFKNLLDKLFEGWSEQLNKRRIKDE